VAPGIVVPQSDRRAAATVLVLAMNARGAMERIQVLLHFAGVGCRSGGL
jgi:hypothetical protein